MSDTAGRVVVCATGLKGAVFISRLLQSHIRIDRIICYKQGDDRSGAFQRIAGMAISHGIELVESEQPKLDPDALVFVVGWQFLLPLASRNMVVFHDSLLPRYRGFAPTVAALIKGESEIGVTAFSPSATPDEGPIIEQAAMPVLYPMKIATALELQAQLMAELASKIFSKWTGEGLLAVPQDGTRATYCLWRDEIDYWIDWSWTAQTIERFVNAVGFPYAGARTFVAGETVTLEEVTVLDDLTFEIRDPGKIWRLDMGRAVVVCGSGLWRIDRASNADGSPYQFKHLRVRLEGRIAVSTS